ncbi:MAG: PAS domain S-box protein [Nitrospirae bacterium]|nr:PAS domain S-box protein [Nitrospirota bacterium]
MQGDFGHNEQCFRALVDNANDGIVVIGSPEVLLYTNKRAAEVLGYSIEEMYNLRIKDVVYPDEADKVLERFHGRMAGLTTPHQYETLMVRKDGRSVPVEFTASITTWRGNPADFVIIRDLTERKKIEAERDVMIAVVEQAVEPIIITNPDAAIVYVNRAFEKQTGYTREEVLGKRPSILQSGRHDRAFYERMWGTLLKGEAWTGVLVNRRKDGTLYQEETVISPIRDADGRIANYVAIKLDVTRERELEAQLRQSQKMEAVGRLAGGVAHDFNNMLTVITGYSEFLLKRLSESDPIRSEISAIRQAGERAAGLTRQLLAFSRRQVLAPQVLSLNKVVSEMEKMLGRLIGEDVEIIMVLGRGLSNVKADPGQIEQVVMNLAVNARDAMPEGGKLTIETADVDLSEAYVREHVGVVPGRHVMLSVSDTGHGMDDETRSHIFEPFFTTKEVGKGTGLGLATVYGIVKQSGGHVSVYSEPGRGTAFKIYLPRAEEEATPGQEVVPSEELRGTETVLLVEDEEGVRDLASRVLRENGYTVFEAENGQTALDVLDRHEGPVDLVLTDVVMPGMNGFELTKRASVLRPGSDVLYMSGYTEEMIGERGLLEADIPFLPKPFTPEALLRKVREVLASRRTSGERRS